MKRFFTLCMVLCLTAITTVSVAEAASKEIDYLNYDFPKDAIILYQDKDGVIYQSKEESSITPRSTEYNSAWVNAGFAKTGSFSITNPHPLGGTTNGTFKIESNYSNASGQMKLHNGVTLLASKTLSVSNGDVHFSFNTVGSNLVVTYFTGNISNTYGMRFMCWLW